MFDMLYRNSRTRVAELSRSLTAKQLDTRVAGSPEWTGRQVVAHLTGVAADMNNRNFAGAPLEPWTAAQVRAREGRSLDELLSEWAEVGPVVEAGLADRTFGVISVYDVLTHECDLRETYALGKPPQDEVDAVLRSAAKGRFREFTGPGTLVVRAGEHEWIGGDGEPRAVLTVEPYELFRGLLSRRSRRQMRAWQWDGAPDAAIDRLPVFGPRDDDQPLPP